MLKNIPHFIVIDDDHVSNALSRMIIKSAVQKRADIDTFTRPEKGFEYIVSGCSKCSNVPGTVILLDLNMPVMTGWQFLDRFDELDEKIKERFKIYIVSSFDDPAEKKRAGSNKNVVDYVEKPITRDFVKKIIGNDSNR